MVPWLPLLIVGAAVLARRELDARRADSGDGEAGVNSPAPEVDRLKRQNDRLKRQLRKAEKRKAPAPTPPEATELAPEPKPATVPDDPDDDNGDGE